MMNQLTIDWNHRNAANKIIFFPGFFSPDEFFSFAFSRFYTTGGRPMPFLEDGRFGLTPLYFILKF